MAEAGFVSDTLELYYLAESESFHEYAKDGGKRGVVLRVRLVKVLALPYS